MNNPSGIYFLLIASIIILVFGQEEDFTTTDSTIVPETTQVSTEPLSETVTILDSTIASNDRINEVNSDMDDNAVQMTAPETEVSVNDSVSIPNDVIPASSVNPDVETVTGPLSNTPNLSSDRESTESPDAAEPGAIGNSGANPDSESVPAQNPVVDEALDLEPVPKIPNSIETLPGNPNFKANSSTNSSVGTPVFFPTFFGAYTPNFICSSPGHFAARPSCTDYYVCRFVGLWLLGYKESCHFGLEFSSLFKFCVPTHLSDCKTDILPLYKGKEDGLVISRFDFGHALDSGTYGHGYLPELSPWTQ